MHDSRPEYENSTEVSKNVLLSPIHSNAVDVSRPCNEVQNPTASRWVLSPARRMMDVVVSLFVLVLLGLPMLLIGLCVRLNSKGPALFVQQRMGRGGHLFSIYKFRSMCHTNGVHPGPGLTWQGDRRVTSLGRWLRRLKLDELPQFINVLRGDMSLVGPRPKLSHQEALHNMPYRPGITGAATIAFRHEEEILRAVHPGKLETYYNRRIKPLKARMDARYMARATFGSDMGLVLTTALACLRRSKTSRPKAVPQVHLLPLGGFSNWTGADNLPAEHQADAS
jgi:lipopolysaccharide/colanic/teichoic acid biosynthesis glycosyltransferase